jgi:hypothetical protein
MAKTMNLQLALMAICRLCCSCSKSPQKPPMQIAPPDRGEIMCTQDAMQCPDGSWVGRSGPKCEFACPAGDASK